MGGHHRKKAAAPRQLFYFSYKLYDAQLMFIISHYVDRISYYGMIEFAPSTMTLWPEK